MIYQNALINGMYVSLTYIGEYKGIQLYESDYYKDPNRSSGIRRGKISNPISELISRTQNIGDVSESTMYLVSSIGTDISTFERRVEYGLEKLEKIKALNESKNRK